MERRHFPHVAVALVVAALLMSLLPNGIALAQDGFCPPNHVGIGTPADTSWWIFDFCSYDETLINIGTDQYGDYPCLQHVKVRAFAGINTQPLVWVPFVQDENKFTDIAHIKFYIYTMPLNDFSGWVPPGIDFADWDLINVQYFDSNGNLFSSSQTAINNHWYMTSYRINSWGITQYYNIYLVDVYLATDDGYGGYFRIGVDQPDVGGAYNQDMHPRRDWAIASLLFGNWYDNIGEMCDVPYNPQPTPTPQPSPTLPATWTPVPGVTPDDTPTPITTPLPTSPMVTVPPSPTMTPIVYPTLMAESTATPYPIPQLQSIAFPTVHVPTLAPIDTPPAVVVTANSTVQAAERATITWSMAGDAFDIATRWADPIDFSFGALDTDASIGGGGFISGTETLSSTNEAIGATLRSITYPIRFMKLVRAYMPNGWVLISFVMILFVLIFGVVIARLAVTIIGEVIDIIRRIWEAIPLN